MYDPKQEAHEFIGEDRQAALAKAQAFFGLGEDELRIHTYEGVEVHGLRGRTVVVAMPKDAPPPRTGGGGDREARGGGRDRDRGGRGDRGDRGDRDRDRDRGRGDRDRDRGDRGRGRRRDRDRGERAESSAPVLSDEPSVGTASGELGEIGSFVLGAIERLEVGPFEISESSEGDVTAIEVKGAAAEVLAAGEARAIDALQLLANQVQARVEPDGNGRVVLDMEGGSDARDKHLERLAERVAKRAVEGGKAIALDPMNGRDRRAVHVSLRDFEGVATMSMGEGRYRQVVVVPEGAPEYEEALRQNDGGDRQRAS